MARHFEALLEYGIGFLVRIHLSVVVVMAKSLALSHSQIYGVLRWILLALPYSIDPIDVD